MKKFLNAVLFVGLMLLSSQAFADITGYNNGTALGRGEEVNFSGGLSASKSGEKFTVGLLGVTNGYVSQVSNTAALPLSYSAVGIPLNASAGQVYTLAAGTPGQIIQFFGFGKTGANTAVITPALATGFNTATLSNAGATVVMQYISSTVGWIILSYDNVAVT